MGLIDNNSVSFRDPSFYKKKEKAEMKLGRKLTREEFLENYYVPVTEGNSTMSETGTSIFDPVLCETQYLWFSKEGDSIIDPFAGGSVRGIVAVELGRKYTGIDLRQEQINANIANAEICRNMKPNWICGDSLNIDTLAPGEYDFLFTCPPYGNLEKYSNDPHDISNMPDEQFDEAYINIMRKASSMLKNNRFASIVIGNYRDKKGYLRDLVGLTVRAMESAGCRYYNDFIFVTPVGSLPVRAGKAFQATRKMGRTHQYMLIFCKGDPKKATERLGDVQIPDMEDYCDDEEP
jgi:DNA modification methylase